VYSLNFNVFRYCCELLAIVLQMAQATTIEKVIQKRPDDVKRLLSVISRYENKDPTSPREIEFFLNLVNALTSIMLYHPHAQQLFGKAGGLQICLGLMRKKNFGRTAGSKLLTVALQSKSF
jgi:hypothetical protein